jgi:type IV pilus assembly protein PilF
MRRLSLIIILIIGVLAPGCSRQNRINVDSKKKTEVKTHINRGRNHLSQRRFQLADSEFQAALKKDPANPDALVGLGLLALARKEFDQAELYFQRALRIDPDYYNIYNYLGIAYSEEDNYIEAKKMFLRLINTPLYRTPEMAYFNLCKLELKRNNLQSALRYANSGLKYDEEYAPLYFIKGLIYKQLEDYEKALLFFKKADDISRDPDLELLIHLAETYYQVGDFENALTILDTAFGLADAPEIVKRITDLQKKINREN